jgi:predicted nucleic acid-binding protein
VERPYVALGDTLEVYLADANVLYSRVLRDYLLYAMRARLISVTWSQGILDEMAEHLMANRPGFTQQSADRLVRAMTVTFPRAQRDPGPGHFALLDGIGLPDEDDRHVIAAAIAAQASFICTHNAGDFPPDVLAQFGLAVVTPDELLTRLIRKHKPSMLWVHRTHVASLAGATDDTTIAALRKADAPLTADLLAQVLASGE